MVLNSGWRVGGNRVLSGGRGEGWLPLGPTSNAPLAVTALQFDPQMAMSDPLYTPQITLQDYYNTYHTTSHITLQHYTTDHTA